ncbi:MAG: hypothetical protein J1E41_00705 [Ruminococcus sp.]|nr:hypothetical protein [Ruminococcus sp.]
MNEIDAWNAFWYSGRIYDYLMYKSIHNDRIKSGDATENKDEIYNQRTYNQGTEYRGEG